MSRNKTLNNTLFEIDIYPPHPKLDEKLWILFLKRKRDKWIDILYTIEFGNGTLDITKRTSEEDTQEIKTILEKLKNKIEPFTTVNSEDIKIEDIDF